VNRTNGEHKENLRLRARRRQLSLTQEELAERVGVHEYSIRRWEAGTDQPQPLNLRKLCQVLGASQVELGFCEEAPGPDGIAEALEIARLADSSDVGPELIESTQLAVERLRRQYSNTSSRVLGEEIRPRLRVVSQLLQGRMRLSQHRDLLQAGGWLALLLATVSWDLKQRQNAFAYRDLAWQFSRQTGDQELEAWAQETPAWFALIEKRYQETVELSRSAQEIAPKSFATVAGLLQEGRAWARLGATSQSVSALSKAHGVLERMPVPARLDDHYTVDPAKWEFYAGTCYALLGQSREAERHARAVIAESSDPGGENYWPARVAISHIDLGLALAQRGQFDEAGHEAGQAFSSPVCHRSTMQRAGELDQMLARRSEVPQVRDFHERYLQAAQAGTP